MVHACTIAEITDLLVQWRVLANALPCIVAICAVRAGNLCILMLWAASRNRLLYGLAGPTTAAADYACEATYYFDWTTRSCVHIYFARAQFEPSSHSRVAIKLRTDLRQPRLELDLAIRYQVWI